MIRSRPYSLRIASAILIVAGLLLATATGTLVMSLHSQAGLDETSRLETVALLLSSRYLATMHGDGTVSLLVQEALPEGLRLTVLNAAGSAVADSSFDPGRIANRLADPEVQEAL